MTFFVNAVKAGPAIVVSMKIQTGGVWNNCTARPRKDVSPPTSIATPATATMAGRDPKANIVVEDRVLCEFIRLLQFALGSHEFFVVKASTFPCHPNSHCF